MNRFLLSLALSGGIAISFAMPVQAASKVHVGALSRSEVVGERRSPFKPKKTAKDRTEMQGISSKLHFEGNRPLSNSARVPKRNAADMDIPVIYGNVIDSYELYDLGLYQLPRSEDEEFEPLIMDIEGERGGVALGDVYYVTYDDYDGGIVRGYSLENGEVVYETEIPSELVPIDLCLNPSDNKLYGIFFPEDYSDGYVFANIDYSTDTPQLTAIGNLPEGYYSALSCDAMGNMYVLRDLMNDDYELYDSEFFKVDTSSGDLSLIGNVGYYSDYYTSGCIDPATGRMFYAVCTWDACSLVEIDVKTGQGTELIDFPNMEEIVGMFCPMPDIDAKAPGKVENLQIHFSDSELEGKVTFDVPTTLNDGTDATEEMFYHVVCNDEEKSGSVLPGTSAEVDVALPAPGKYTFKVYLSNESGVGAACLAETFIGEDTPALPSDFTAGYADGKMTLKWTSPEVGADGGYIDADKIAYTLTQLSPEEKLLEEDIDADSIELPIEAPEARTLFSYALTMRYGGQEIGTVNSNNVVLGSLLPPYVQDFTAPESMDDVTVIDGNEDDYAWSYFGGCVRIESNQEQDSDDWMILPGIKLTEGIAYSVSFRSWCQSVAYPEKLEVMVGTEPTVEGMVVSLLEPTVISNLQSGAQTFEAKFEPSATGVYYIGFHAVSDADSFYLYLTDVSVAKGADAAAPSAPSEFSVTPDALGNPLAEISFIVPSTLVSGDEMDAPDEVKVLCGDEVIKVYDKPEAGTSVSFSHTLEACGDYTFSVVAVKDGMESDMVSQTVYCGPGMPGAVTGVTLSEIGDTGEVILKWEAVDSNILGNPINPELVKYNIFRIEDHTVVDVVASDFGGTEISLSPEFDEPQTFVRYAVYAVTDKGQGVGMESEMLPIGTPYTEFAESFADGQLSYMFGVNAINDGLLGIYGDSYFDGVESFDGDNGFMLFYGEQAGQGMELSSGKISIADMEQPVLDLYLRNFGNDDVNQFEVEVRAVGKDYMTKLSTTPPAVGDERWNLVRIPLSEVESGTAQFRLRGIINNYGSIGIDNIKVYDAKTTAVTSPMDSQFRVSTVKGAIRIEGGEGHEAMLHSVAGISRRMQLTGDMTISVPSGVYVISTANQNIKVIVP